MSARDDLRRKVRGDFVYRRMTAATIAVAYNLSEATIGRWKKAAKDQGDDWDKARTAAVIAGEGLETVVSQVVEDFMILAQALLDDIRDGELSTSEKVSHLVALADAQTKMVSSARKLAPKISELGVAQDVMGHLLTFVRENFPQHAAAILEIIEPFGERLAGLYTS